MKFYTFVSLLLFLQVSICEAQADFFDRLSKERVASDSVIVWEQVSPGNAGFANLLRYHPTIPGKVAFCPDMWCVYQSENNGTRWYGITDPDGDGSFNHLRDLYYSASNAELALAICGSEVWASQDTGRTWQIVPNCPWYVIDTDGSDKQGWKSKVASLCIDPDNKDVWFIGGGSNVRGQDWLSCYEDVTAANYRGKPADYEGKLWRTTNGGASWTEVGADLDARAQVGRIIVNPRNSDQVFASSNYGVYRSDNGGRNWTQVSHGQLDNDVIMDMDYYYNADKDTFILYLIDQVHYLPDTTSTRCTGGIFYSADEGDTWTKINGDLALDINRLSGGVPANYYKYIAKWMGLSESQVKSSYPGLPVRSLQYFNMISADPSREGALYVGFADPQVANSIMPGRLWTTSNNGEKWTNTARLYQDTWEKDSAYWNERGNPYHENMTIGHDSPHMRFGTDYALRSMRALDVGVDGSVMIVSDHSTMLSTDHGESWHQVDEDYTPSGAIVGHGNSNLPGLTIAQDRRFETTLLGSGEHRLWIPVDDSPDARQAIKYITSAQQTVRCLAFDPFDGKKVYATSSRQAYKQNIFRSTDGGHHWENYGVATPATNKWLDDFYTNGLTIDPVNRQYMYFGITKIVDPEKGTMGGFFVSDNYGKTFSRSNEGLPSPARINDIAFDPRDNSRASLFIAAEYNNFSYHLPLSSGGLYHSADRGANWTKVNTPLGVKGVNAIEIDHTNRMYITTGYRGAGNGAWYSDDFGDTWQQVFKYPGAQFIDISPYDHNFIVLSVEHLAKNPGIYVSRDRGFTWSKSNTNIVIPHKVHDIRFNIHRPDQLWAATLGTGFYKGYIKDGDEVQVVEVNPKVIESIDGYAVQLSSAIVNPEFSGEVISWKSENPGIVSVDENGLVTPLGRGQTKIWATAVDGRYSDFSVLTVHESPLDSIAFSSDTIKMAEGSQDTLELNLYPPGATDTGIVFKSGNPLIAGISENIVTAKDVGTTSLTASHTTSGLSDSCVLVVYSTVGINNAKTQQWNMYPNPAQDFITVELDGVFSSPLELSIIDNAGNTCYFSRFPGNETRIAVNDLPDGVYYIKLSSGSFQSSRKVVVSKSD